VVAKDVTEVLTPDIVSPRVVVPTSLAQSSPLGTPPADWVAIVANPFSGNGSNRQVVARLEQALADAGLTSRALWDPTQRDTMLADPQWAKRCRCVVVAGGDGTVADVLNQTTDIPIAMVPIGNENLFARQFGYDQAEQVAQAVIEGHTRRIDLGRANGKLFSCMVSAGFDADVVKRVTAWRTNGNAEGHAARRIKRLSYVRPALGALAGYRYPKLTLETEHRTVTGAHAIVFNLPQYAMGLPFVPEARDDDGQLHWVVFEKPGMVALGGYLASVALRRHHRCSTVHHGTARRLSITATGEAAVQVDGDAAGVTPIDVEIVRDAVDVIVP